MKRILAFTFSLFLSLILILQNNGIALAAPSISLSQNSGPWGSIVTVTGSDFGATETGITLTYDGTQITTNPSSITAVGGSWTANITIPYSVPGPHTIRAIGPTTGIVLAPIFTIPFPSISVSRNTGPAGAPITVNGSGFGANESNITVTYDGSTVGPRVFATPQGTWISTFLIPTSTNGNHNVSAFGANTLASSVPITTFIITPSISISQTSGAVGNSISVSGSGFTAGESGITVTFDNSAVASGITAGNDGTWRTNILIPASTGGSHNIKASSSTAQASSDMEASFRVNPSISISQASGSPGTSITVNGSGFGANESSILVTYDSVAIVTGLSATSSGAWNTILTIPPSTYGSHIIKAFGSITQAANVADVSFRVQGGIALSRNSGAPGSSITVSGSGFTSNETGITVTFDNATIISDISANEKGVWTAVVTVPPSTFGSHVIRAYGSTTQSSSVGEVTFTMQGGISLSRNSGPPGSLITVSGSGFSRGEGGITVTYDGATVASGISANPQGAWSATFTVPSSISGQHSVKAYGSITQTASVGESIFIVVPNISLSKISATPGTTLTVNGSGFGPGESGINITYDNNPVASSISANSQGAWNATFTVPPSTTGPHSIKASGATTQITSIPEASLSIIPQITLSRTNALPGSSLTINGVGFVSNEAGITVTYDDNQVASGISANAQGSWSVSFTVPQSTSGTHKIKASSPTTQAASIPEVNLSITPTITLSRTTVTPGTSLTITGSGFSPNETDITVSYNGTPVVSNISASGQGAWSASFIAPQSASGSHSVKASGPTTSGTIAPETSLTISSAISINRNNAPPGSPITVTGSGFGLNEAGITVTYDGTQVASGISANAQGAWTTTFNLPQSTSGSHSIKASGSTTQAAIAPEISITIGSSISLNQTRGMPGTSVTITGFGFSPSETGITVTYDGAQLAYGISANAQGSWSINLIIPPSASGNHTIKAYGPITQTTSTGEISFNVTPIISLNPNSGSVSSKVDITGSGFAANSALKITYDSTDIPTNGKTTDASGSFTISFTVPKSKAGTHTINVGDAKNNEYKVSFSLESMPPAIPRLLSPEKGSRAGILGDSAPTFRWADVADPSGVTYILQISMEQDFAQPILEKLDLNRSTYTLTEDEALPRGEYYWRVLAVDGASNRSDWSQPFMLKSGLMALWVLLTILVGAIGVIVTAIYFLLLRRPAKKAVQVPETTAPVVQAYWRELEAEEAPKPRLLPWRRALPPPSKTVKLLPPEDHARLKILADFAQSLPLIEPDYTVEWLVELVETATGKSPSPDTYEQLVQGQIVLVYQPVWTSHPLYLDMRSLLERQPVLDDLDKYVDSVSHCASDSISLLQDIYRDITAEISAPTMSKGWWSFISAIYADVIGWFRGKSLREPSERDYVIKVANAPDGGPNVVWLYGGETTSFPGPLVQAIDEKEVEQLRILHQKLRRAYRSNDNARQLVSIITQLQVQRFRLINTLNQFGDLSERS